MNAIADSRLPALVVFLFVLLLLGGCAGTGTGDRPEQTYTRIAPTGAFPVPPEIQPNVDFWRNVYSNWGRNQVALHDDEHLGVVYEVINLPVGRSDGYTPDQKAIIQGHQDTLKFHLRSMQEKTGRGEALSSEERALRDKLVAAGGTSAIYGADDRVRVQRGLRERFRRGVEISGRYEPAFREAFRSAGLPEDLVYLPHVESSYQLGAVSSAGATGVWQFMPATGRNYMLVGNAVDERLDPVVSAKAAARYLDEAYSRLGTWPLAITSYNHGVGGMARAKAEHGSDFGRIVRQYQGPAFKFASRNYYAEFLAAREIANHPETYFPGIVRQAPLTEERIVLPASMPASQVASHYGVSLDRLAATNLAWRESARSGRALLPAGHTVWLPAGSTQRVAGLPSAASPARIGTFEIPSKPAGRSELVFASEDDWPRPVRRAPVAEAAPKVAIAAPQPRAAVPAQVAPVRAQPVKALAAVSEDEAAAMAVLAKADRTSKSVVAAKAVAQGRTDKATGGPKEIAPAKDDKTAKTAQPAKDKRAQTAAVAKNDKGTKTSPKTEPKASQHVVQANETLYRVATRYEISVEQLRRLNGMKGKDNSIRPGQRLRVSI
jgi:membrane-bound lytic murein transglycosylase D